MRVVSGVPLGRGVACCVGGRGLYDDGLCVCMDDLV